MALVVHVEPVLHGVVLQIGHEPGDIDDCHLSCCAPTGSFCHASQAPGCDGHPPAAVASMTRSPSARVRNARPRWETARFSLGAISAKVRPSPSSGTNTGS